MSVACEMFKCHENQDSIKLNIDYCILGLFLQIQQIPCLKSDFLISFGLFANELILYELIVEVHFRVNNCLCYLVK